MSDFAKERRDTWGRRIRACSGSGLRHFDTIEAKFDARHQRGAGCWMWTGYIAPTGYGTIGPRYAHRISYERFVGPIPSDMTVDHICHVRACVNPAHLRLLTRGENASDQWRTLRTHCKHGHDLNDPANVYPPKDGRKGRRCRPCAIRRANESGMRRRAA